MSIGSHHSSRMIKDEWLTPPHIIQSLGDFDLDPCSPIVRPWETAATHYTVDDDGLARSWHGRVWLNPPYGRRIGAWMRKMADHNNGVALVFARVETKFFFDYVWGCAAAILFIRGRLFFYDVSGKQAEANSGAPSCLIAYGGENAEALKMSGIDGKLIFL